MEAFATDWLGLLVRWAHVIAAIAWIGHAFMFHSIEHHLRAPEVDDVPDDVEGELWMVHGGGFFRMQKTRVLPDKMTGELKWFKWEAALTWITGFLLLMVVFYMGGGLLLTDSSVSDVSTSTAMLIGIGTLVLGWAVYDLLWWSPLGKSAPAVATALTVAMVFGVAYGLSQVLSGRAAYILVGAMLGTMMTANVWMRILPGMRRMIASLEAGEEPDFEFGRIGKQRSVHNGYMHLPIIFIMISNHYPSMYGHDLRWVVLILLMILGAGMRQVMYDGIRTHIAVFAVVLASSGGLVYLTLPEAAQSAEKVSADAVAIDSATVGSIAGVVSFDGQAPDPAPLTLYGGCEKSDVKAVDDSVMVADGKLENAFVYIGEGADKWIPPAAPSEEVEVDQRGCFYVPHVVGVRVGQPITFINSDPMYHNVRGEAETNTPFNLDMPAKDQRITRKLMRQEVMVKAKCDVHPWMASWIGVMNHPWFAVTDASGAFSLAGVPPGTYTVVAWHEVFGTTSQQVTVEASKAAEATFAFTGQ